jgi:hypothetical protein
MNYPTLIEPNSLLHINNTLHKCHEKRISIYYYVLNGGILLLFVLIFGLALYFCHTNKPSQYEKHQQMLKDQDLILSKIRYHQDVHKQRESQMSNITNLPYTHS